MISFLTPLFMAGLAALGIPILIHLIQRERRRVVAFPSLMFLRRIPYQSVQRRRIRHWALLLLRLTALALIVAAFARPFIRRSQGVAATAGGAREVVVLLDTSYSMGYGDRWARARAAARQAVSALNTSDRASLVLFSGEPEVAVRSTADRGRLAAAIDAAQPGAGATRFGPALKLAGSILNASPLLRREVILITDFQRRGWIGADGVRLPDGAALTPMAVAGTKETDESPNVAVTPVTLQRSMFENQERVVVTAGAMNRGARPVTGLEMTLEIGGRAVQTERLDIEPNGSAMLTFAPVTLAGRDVRGTVRIAADALARDNTFHFVVSPAVPLRVAIGQLGGARAETGLYFARALSIGETPRFDVSIEDGDAISAEDLQRSAVVVLNDVPVSPALSARLAQFVEAGGGLLVALGARAAWPAGAPDILPALPGALVDRSRDPARLGALEYGHPVFELFRAPRAGDFSAARFYSYRAVGTAETTPARAPHAGGQVLARFDDGAPALLERNVGAGRVLMWTSSLDRSANDLALKPVFLPFVHQLLRHLSNYSEPAPWRTVGQVVDAGAGLPSQASRPGSAASLAGLVGLTPSGRRVALEDGEGSDVLELTEQGFYELRQRERATTVASNVDLSESDLTLMDPREIVVASAASGGGVGRTVVDASATSEADERTQRLWWYLLFGGVVLLGAETLLSNRGRISHAHR